MELKPRYQYTYFVHPYIIPEKEYTKYIQKILKTREFRIRIFQKEADYDIFNYFLPKTRDYMFSSFHYKNPEKRMLEESKIETKTTLLSKEPCTVFEYKIKRDIQGKVQEGDGIFFKIQKLELICFKTGICFLCIKTNVEDLEEFSNILNFNYKFRDINRQNNKLNNFDKIRVQPSTFKDIQTFTELIQDITGEKNVTHKLNIDTERFLTYSYLCVDQDAWNNNTDFSDIETSFSKFINILPNDVSTNLEENKAVIISKWKYAKVGITKQGVALFCSTAEINNYTKLAQEFETIYLYTYLFTLYKKIYLKKISDKFQRTRICRIYQKNMGTRNYNRNNRNCILSKT